MEKRLVWIGGIVFSILCWVIIFTVVARAEYDCESPEVKSLILDHFYAGVSKTFYGMTLNDVRRSSKEEILEKCNAFSASKCNSVFDCNLGKEFCRAESEAIHKTLEVEDAATLYAIGANPDIGQYQCIWKRFTPADKLAVVIPRSKLWKDMASNPLQTSDQWQQVNSSMVKYGKTQEDWDLYYNKIYQMGVKMLIMQYQNGLTEEVPFTVQPSQSAPGFLVRLIPEELKQYHKAY